MFGNWRGNPVLLEKYTFGLKRDFCTFGLRSVILKTVNAVVNVSQAANHFLFEMRNESSNWKNENAEEVVDEFLAYISARLLFLSINSFKLTLLSAMFCM